MIHDNFVLSFNGKNLLKNDKEMLWQRNIYQVTTSTDGHGSITASPMSGYQGTTVSLSNTPNANYGFKNYDLTGATLTGNQFIMNNDVTAKANFSALPEYTAKSVSNYYMSTNASAWFDSDVGNVNIREIKQALNYNLPYSTTAVTNTFYLMPTNSDAGTFVANSGLFEGYKVAYVAEYPGFYRYSGKYLNTSAFVSGITMTNVPWVHLNETATTRDIKLYASINGGPMKEFVTFENISPGTTQYLVNAVVGGTQDPTITTLKGNKISITIYCPDTAVSANVTNCMPHWYGTISGLK